jgi:hypothetical protein
MNKISVLDPYSILVINRNGFLFRLHCPFTVFCKCDIENYKKGNYLLVDKVSETLSRIIRYSINGKYYEHSHFELIIKI